MWGLRIGRISKSKAVVFLTPPRFAYFDCENFLNLPITHLILLFKEEEEFPWAIANYRFGKENSRFVQVGQVFFLFGLVRLQSLELLAITLLARRTEGG